MEKCSGYKKISSIRCLDTSARCRIDTINWRRHGGGQQHHAAHGRNVSPRGLCYDQEGKSGTSECTAHPLFYNWWAQEVFGAQPRSNNRDLTLSTSRKIRSVGFLCRTPRDLTADFQKLMTAVENLGKIGPSPLNTFAVNNLRRSHATSSHIFVRADYTQPGVPRRNDCNGPFSKYSQ